MFEYSARKIENAGAAANLFLLFLSASGLRLSAVMAMEFAIPSERINCLNPG